MVISIQNIIKVEKRDIKPAAKIASLAFDGDPIWDWLIPEGPKRHKKLMAAFELYVRCGMKYGFVTITSRNYEGVAIWTDSEKAKDSYFAYFRCGMFKFIRIIGLRDSLRSLECNDFLMEHNKKNMTERHWHLIIIAVKPEFQSQGSGSLLMRNMLKSTEKSNYPYYLETQKENLLDFYAKFGFKIVEKIIVPKGGMPVWCMAIK